MNITPISIVKNRFQRTAFLVGAIAIAGHVMVKNPVEEKRQDIIASMNKILSEDSILLETGNEYTIVVEGKAQGMQAILVSNDKVIHVKKFPNHVGTHFTTQINGIEVDSNKKLEIETGCMIIEEEGYLVMDPPNCSSEKKDRIIL